jgi:hypothetical protein
VRGRESANLFCLDGAARKSRSVLTRNQHEIVEEAAKELRRCVRLFGFGTVIRDVGSMQIMNLRILVEGSRRGRFRRFPNPLPERL